MRRLLFGTLILTFVAGVVLGAGAALAAPSNRTSIALSCDRDVELAQIAVTVLNGAAETGPFNLKCGSGPLAGSKNARTTQITPNPADGVRVEAFAVVAAGGSLQCTPTEVHELPAKISCALDSGETATVTVR